MEDKSIKGIIEEFFETGVLNCSLLQFQSIYEYTIQQIKRIREEKGHDSVDLKIWTNFYTMLVTYKVETKITLGEDTSNLKVSFRDYLKTIYNLGEGELDSITRDIVYQRYVDFTKQNCCKSCIYLDIKYVCSTCPCGEIWDIYKK